MDIEELVKKIEANMENINNNSKKIEENFERISQNSGALEILRGFKSDSEKWYSIATKLIIVMVIIILMWCGTIGYLVYILNDIGTIEETTEVNQENESGYNNYIGNDGDIYNGKAESKENN